MTLNNEVKANSLFRLDWLLSLCNNYVTVFEKYSKNFSVVKLKLFLLKILLWRTVLVQFWFELIVSPMFSSIVIQGNILFGCKEVMVFLKYTVMFSLLIQFDL